MNEKKLKEGCGKEYNSNIKVKLGLQKMKICGASGLCPICQAKLKIFQECKAQKDLFIEKLKEELDKCKEGLNYDFEEFTERVTDFRFKKIDELDKEVYGDE